MSERSMPENLSGALQSGVGDTRLVDSLGKQAHSLETHEPEKPVKPRLKRYSWLKNWVVWLIIAGLTSGGIGVVAIALILKLPGLPNCPTVFWPTASASMRLYCAEVAANKQTPDDLLQAIALVNDLPSNHPLRPQINNLLKQWSEQLLGLAEQEFQAGNLSAAIAIAHKIPENLPAAPAIQQQVEKWQSIWSEAAGIYNDAVAEIHQQHWHQAFSLATKLLAVNNNYWASNKYDELNNRIDVARSDSKKLAQAQNLAEAGGLDNILAAIKLAEAVGPNSDFYQDAKAALPNFGRQLLDMAQQALDHHDADQAIKIATSIPASTNLQAEAEDLSTIADASRNAWTETKAGLETAIVTANNITPDRPMYNQAQELVNTWQLEISDINHLDRAQELAQSGTVKDLRAAITEVQLIPDQNPLAAKRNQEIAQWQQQIETIEDRPYLDLADQLASSGQAKDLQAAITEASQISQGRALYPEARRRIESWNYKIEEIQDQPYLDRAHDLASSGDLPGAIAAAKQIQPGRALASKAQAAINDWEEQIRARENWQQAQQLAAQGTPDALSEAIHRANLVPDSSPWRSDVNKAMNQWSQQILNLAQARAGYDLAGAIAIAKQIPASTSAYKAAQQQIQQWQNWLNPEPQDSPPLPETQ